MYNRQDVFKKHIQKKAEELNDLCKTLGVVSFMSFAVKDNGVSTDYKNYIYGSTSNGIRLSNDFQTVPPGDNIDADDYMDDIDDN